MFTDTRREAYYTPRNEVVGGILVSPCPSVRPSVDKSYVVRLLELCFLKSFKILSAVYRWGEQDPFHFWRFSLLSFQSYWTWYDGKWDFYPMSYDTLSSVSQNVLKFYQQLTGEKRRIPFIFDDFHFCRSRVIGLDMTENRIITLCRTITWVVFLRMFWNFISSLPVKRGGSLSFLVGTISNVLVMEIGWTYVGRGVIS
jgi:hypothetical protein